jgi:hypothetical protein
MLNRNWLDNRRSSAKEDLNVTFFANNRKRFGNTTGVSYFFADNRRLVFLRRPS